LRERIALLRLGGEAEFGGEIPHINPRRLLQMGIAFPLVAVALMLTTSIVAILFCIYKKYVGVYIAHIPSGADVSDDISALEAVTGAGMTDTSALIAGMYVSMRRSGTSAVTEDLRTGVTWIRHAMSPTAIGFLILRWYKDLCDETLLLGQGTFWRATRAIVVSGGSGYGKSMWSPFAVIHWLPQIRWSPFHSFLPIDVPEERDGRYGRCSSSPRRIRLFCINSRLPREVALWNRC
jgi:hypothetical protein